MIQKADVIAIITITDVRESDTNGKTWTYRQMGKAAVETLLKGAIPKDFTIYGSETFICAQCPLSRGRFIAFLKKDDALWTGSNWHLSLRPIKGNEVDWYVDDQNRYDMKPSPLGKVLDQIKAKARVTGDVSRKSHWGRIPNI